MPNVNDAITQAMLDSAAAVPPGALHISDDGRHQVIGPNAWGFVTPAVTAAANDTLFSATVANLLAVDAAARTEDPTDAQGLLMANLLGATSGTHLDYTSPSGFVYDWDVFSNGAGGIALKRQTDIPPRYTSDDLPSRPLANLFRENTEILWQNKANDTTSHLRSDGVEWIVLAEFSSNPLQPADLVYSGQSQNSQSGVALFSVMQIQWNPGETPPPPVGSVRYMNGVAYELSANRTLGMDQVLNETQRDALTVVPGVVSAVFVTLTNSWHEWNGTAWINVGVDFPVHPGNPVTSPEAGNRTRFSDWREIGRETIDPAHMPGNGPAQLESAQKLGQWSGMDVFGPTTDLTLTQRTILQINGHTYFDVNIGSRRPPKIIVRDIFVTNIDVGIEMKGYVLGGYLEFRHMVGPGALFPYAAIRGGAERIGILLGAGGHFIKYESISGFNINILGEGFWTAVIKPGNAFACGYIFHTRVSATGQPNQSVRWESVGGGGAYNNSQTGNFAQRQQSSADGMRLEGLRMSEIDANTLQYCQIRDGETVPSDAAALHLSADCKELTVTAYLEGPASNAYLLYSRAEDCKFNLMGPMGGPTGSFRNKGIVIGSGVSRVNFLGTQGDSTTEALLLPAGGAAVIDIANDNIINGPNRLKRGYVHPVHRGELFPPNSTIAYQSVSGGTRQFPGAGFAPWRNRKRSVQFRSTGVDGQVNLTWGPVDVTGDSGRQVFFETRMANNRVDKGGQIAVYIMDQANVPFKYTTVTFQPAEVAGTPDSEWFDLQLDGYVPPGTTAINIRAVSLNQLDAELGYELRMMEPYLSFEKPGEWDKPVIVDGTGTTYGTAGEVDVLLELANTLPEGSKRIVQDLTMPAGILDDSIPDPYGKSTTRYYTNKPETDGILYWKEVGSL